MKKKFKITGQEDALYQARVVVTAKGRKTDLPVKAGDTISIIRTANCPKGKWLARDSTNSYGYVAVDHVELDIKEMLELGRKTHPGSNNNFIEPDGARMISHDSNHYQLPGESFTDDSEEWSGDDDEPPSGSPSTQAVLGHTRTFSMPDVGNKDLSVNHQHSHSDMGHDSSHNQALQRLSTFFHSQKNVEPAASTDEPVMSYTAGSVNAAQEANHTPEAVSAGDTDFVPDTLILPPPVMYADGVE
ncbi:FYN-binding protein-like isoform X2 [Pundamilia nyererei]|uniref:FYN-binding protein-like isoform X2 n=3 Tax=Haplochromini TaxID=319058 RepID=A0A9Y3R556_9CICH|nr:FYN-binding protein 1 [Maylandia zebra]XP_005732294.1 PREDICTED: FYN-binding protein-like isoform X2 [Pundamilia nyererei]XP_012776200.1 FYN-binding protein 1 [Maylandia zebra]